MMAKFQDDPKPSQWLVFVGALLLIIGMYSAIRTVINYSAYRKYPTTGVLPMMLSANSFPAYQREEDCVFTNTYTDSNGNPRAASADEKKRDEESKESCVTSVQEARRSAQINDISGSILFLVLGLGSIFGRRFLFR